jgi:hypothetical protein
MAAIEESGIWRKIENIKIISVNINGDKRRQQNGEASASMAGSIKYRQRAWHGVSSASARNIGSAWRGISINNGVA